jgi:hypothetical protein
MTWWDEQTPQRQAAINAVLDSSRGQAYLRYAYGDRGFAAWLLVADTIRARRLGASIFDIADWSWRDAYDAGQQPGAAVRDALEADDTVHLLLGDER